MSEPFDSSSCPGDSNIGRARDLQPRIDLRPNVTQQRNGCYIDYRTACGAAASTSLAIHVALHCTSLGVRLRACSLAEEDKEDGMSRVRVRPAFPR